MGKYDALLKKIRECYDDLMKSAEEIRKLDSHSDEAATQLASLDRMKGELDRKLRQSAALMADPKIPATDKLVHVGVMTKLSEQLVKTEQGLTQLRTARNSVLNVAQDARRAALTRQKTWQELMEDLVNKAKEVLKKEEDAALRDGLKKIDWKKVGFAYAEPPRRK